MDIQIPKQIGVRTNLFSTNRNMHTVTLSELFLLVLVIGLFSWFIIKPKFSQLSVLRNDLATVQEEENKLSENLDKLNGLITKMGRNTEKVAKLDKALPLEYSPVKLNQFLENFAGTSGVALGGLNVPIESDLAESGNRELTANRFKIERELKTVKLNLYVMGTFNQIYDFLQKIENSGRIIDVNSMTISANSDGFLDMKFNANMYYYAAK